MLFNSYPFLLVFLPLVLAGVALLRGHTLAITVFVQAASLVFYAYWSSRAVFILGGSVLFNFAISRAMMHARDRSRSTIPWLVLGISGDLALLGYFKYRGFAAEVINEMAAAHLPVPHIALPLAISFFTFEQISYLVDLHRGLILDRRALNFGTFALFFPRLLAGPIVRYNDIARQLPPAGPGFSPSSADVAVGVFMFTVGLAKKVLFGDSAAALADPVFAATASGQIVPVATAVVGALAFGLQIYFDFSGYSDMTIGLARILGIQLPENFASPYRASSIVDFWRRWHVTLSTWLRDYLYIPLGGNQHGATTKYAALAATMVLGGIWHGAGWTFVIWGAIHGALLIINHAWRAARSLPSVPRPIGWALTFLFVNLAWIFFRAPDFAGAVNMLTSLSGLASPTVDLHPGVMANFGIDAEAAHGPQGPVQADAFLVSALVIVLALPNTQTIAGTAAAVSGSAGAAPVKWRPSRAWAAATAALLILSMSMLAQPSKFIYFQF